MSDFKQVFGVPLEHRLWLVRPGAAVERGGRVCWWEHEEYDADRKLVAVYESWSREDGGLDFVKYSPHGWVLSISGRCPRNPPQKPRTRPVHAASP